MGVSNIGALETITFGESQAVAMSTSMAEADFSGKELLESGAIIVAAFLPQCQALNKLTISGDSRRSEAVTIETSMTKADFSGKVLEASGAIMLAAFLPKCQAMTSLNLSR